MPFRYYLIIFLSLSSFDLSAQIEVDWTQNSFDYNDKERYIGVFPLVTFDNEVLLAHKFRTKTIDDQFTWGFDYLDGTTGSPTGDFITTNDISPWNATEMDPELNHLVKTEDGYMAFIREKNRITFVKFDKELNILNSIEEGSASAEFSSSTSLAGYGLAESVASSYGLVGATWGRDENSSVQGATPHIFACDTDLNVRFSRRLDNAEYYLGNRFLIDVNAKDEIFTAGHIKGQQLIRSDTVVISKLDAEGELLYTNFLVLGPASLPRVLKMDMNADETELLLSGVILVRDIFDNPDTKAYIARINVQDGSLIKLFTFFAHELGGPPDSYVDLPVAQYDAQGNIVLASLIAIEQFDFDVNVSQIDLDGNVLDNRVLFTNFTGFPWPYTWRFNKVEDNLYLSGSYPIMNDFENKVAFVAKLGDTNATTETTENITAPISFRTSPNPTNGPLTIQWNSTINEAYQIKIINQLSQEIRTYSGQALPGQMNLEFNINYLPAGAYFVKLELENGFAIQSIIVTD